MLNKKIWVFVLFLQFYAFSQETDFAKFSGKQLNVDFVLEIPNQTSFIYADSTYSNANSDEELPFLIKSLNNSQNIKPELRYTFSNNVTTYTILKYREIDSNNNPSESTSEIFQKNNNKWEIENISLLNQDIKDIFFVIKIMNMEFYKNITRIGNDPSHPLVNKIKEQIKDENGVINIGKLVKIIIVEKPKLTKYLDE